MTDRELISEELIVFFRNQQDFDILTEEVDLIESGFLDSLTFVELLVHIENKFGFEVSIEEIELDDFRSISSISSYIQHQNGKKPISSTG